MLVDTLGLLLKVVVHPANIQDREGAKLLLAGTKQMFPRLSLLWVDQGYDGAPFANWVREHVGCEVAVTNKPCKWVWVCDGQEVQPIPSFTLMARRWVIERSFAWGGRNRRLSKDYEGRPETEQALIYMAMGRLALKRLATP